MTTERNKRIILSLRMESNHAPPAFRADVLTTVLERSVDHSFRSVLCSKGNTSNITLTNDFLDLVYYMLKPKLFTVCHRLTMMLIRLIIIVSVNKLRHLSKRKLSRRYIPMVRKKHIRCLFLTV